MEMPQSCEVFRRGRQELSQLFKNVESVSDVVALFGRLASNDTYSSTGEEFRPCLENALAESRTADHIPGLFFAICRWAIQALEDNGPCAWPRQVSLWARGSGPQQVSYSAAQCRSLLANALLLNIHDTNAHLKASSHGGGLDLRGMMCSTKPAAAQKLACILQYFQTSRVLEGTDDNSRQVTFERRVPSPVLQDYSEFKHWAIAEGASMVCEAGKVCLHESPMESASDADAFVNFANPNFGYGHFISSCTQEEIMQVCCPEFNVAMLHQGYMTDGEVVNVSGVRRFSCYHGYANSFRFAGPFEGAPYVQTILTMDATTNRHFTEAMVLRDIRKAYLCFKGCKVVSTGRWGCGVFGGAPAHKFSQQVIAATLAGCQLRFSTFGTPDECDSVLAAVVERRPTAAQLLDAVLISSAAALQRKPFVPTLAAVLRDKVKAPLPHISSDIMDVRATPIQHVPKELMAADMELWLVKLQRLRELEWGSASLEPNEIADWLYLGGAHGWSLEWLLERGITHVVNAAAADSHYTLPSSIKVLEVRAHDTDTYDLFAHWPDVLRFVTDVNVGKVLIHCQVGINRSAALALAALCVAERRPFLRTFRQVLARRPGILTNKHFQQQLLHCINAEGLLLKDVDIDAELEDTRRKMNAVFQLFAEDGLANFDRFHDVLQSIDESPEANAHWETMGMYTLGRRDQDCVELWLRSDAKAALLYPRLRSLIKGNMMQDLMEDDV